jgi:ppGpp synthetase/RelA/SpoT-type nucleotidyltranferase
LKIDKSIRDAYAEQYRLNSLIQDRVSGLRSKFNARWHYEDRLKSEESYALKVEAGRTHVGLTIDDFFACTLVVRNATEIAAATQIVEQTFDVVTRKPHDQQTAIGRPSDFAFDDLRIYTKLKPDYLGVQPINEVIFEIQIKTFLQHAWGIATHDLTYKTDKVSWGKLRVASQIRAMLEHAELSIERFENLAGSDIIAKQHQEYSEIGTLIAAFKTFWTTAALPKDLQRLAQSVRSAASILNASVDEVIKYLKEDTDQGGGANNLDLSPFGTVIQSILLHHPIDAAKVAKSAGRRRRYDRIFISKSVSIPEHLSLLAPDIIAIY